MNLIIRIALILLNMIIISYIFPNALKEQLIFTLLVFVIILLIQIILLAEFLKRTNRFISSFIHAISNSDFTLKFENDSEETPNSELNVAFNKVIDQYQLISREKQTQYFLTDHLIQTIPSGIIVFNEDGRISFKNRLGETLLGLSNISSLKQIEYELPIFYSKISNIQQTGNFVLDISNSGEEKKLSITVKSFNLFNKNQKLISIQDITREVNASELDAIQRLMRTITHEIMNSLTPINSLTETILMLINDETGNPKPIEHINKKNYNDIRESIMAIKERGEGLDHFISNFRTISKLPGTLKKETIHVKDLVNAVIKFLVVELENIDITINLERDDLQIKADNALVEQVLINLIANSLTAMTCTENPKLKIESFASVDKIFIEITDNGVGIPEEKFNDIFTPFYSTKEKGSGIGLSFARQIMILHNGSIKVKSTPNQETSLTLTFNTEEIE